MVNLKQLGHEVIAIAPEKKEISAQFELAGVPFEAVAISGSGVNPGIELLSVFNLYKVIRRNKIDLILSFTPKGNIYSGSAALLYGIPFVPNISGLGRSFVHRSYVTHVVSLLYRATLGRAYRVFFQNKDDLSTFVQAGLVPLQKCHRLPGSGVDIERFKPASLPDRPADCPVFLLVARMLWDKGVGEFVSAARTLKVSYPNASFHLLGFLDIDNPSAISRDQVQAWVDEGIVDYLGAVEDVRPFLARADCVVLPSFYGEGVPRTLLEAAAVMRPVITTDSPGCRDTLVDGVTGFLCRPKDAEDLTLKMKTFIELAPSIRSSMGVAGRKRIEQEFDEKFVLNAYLDLLDSIQEIRKT